MQSSPQDTKSGPEEARPTQPEAESPRPQTLQQVFGMPGCSLILCFGNGHLDFH